MPDNYDNRLHDYYAYESYYAENRVYDAEYMYDIVAETVPEGSEIICTGFAETVHDIENQSIEATNDYYNYCAETGEVPYTAEEGIY